MKLHRMPFIVNGPPCQCGHARICHIGRGRSGIEMFDGPCQKCDCIPAGYLPANGTDYVAMRRAEWPQEVALTGKHRLRDLFRR